VARVEEVTHGVGTKLIRRCPVCQTTALKKRIKKNPRWRCNSGHEFEKPSEKEEPVEKYLAFFGGSFIRLEQTISVTELKGIALRPSDQTSIEELGLAGLERLLAPMGKKVLGMIVAAGFLKPATSDEIEQDIETDVAPSTADEREQILRSIKIRRGQSSFRRGLIKRYDSRCLVTGCELEALLEAAHIAPYRNNSHNDLSNGLLLRADIRADVVLIAQLTRARHAVQRNLPRPDPSEPIPGWLWKRCYRLRNRYHSLEDTLEVQGLRGYA